MRILIYLLAAATLLFIVNTALKTVEYSRNEFEKYYDQFNVTGSFILYDEKNDQIVFYNKPQSQQWFTPASTFKICNSLIGLETGVVKDENFIFAWDSVIRQNPDWNKDQDLKSAFQNSTVWYYQEIARRVGGKKMKSWLDSAGYGNADTSGGIDKFWLTGGLKITPLQQIDFLRKLQNDQLPFSKRSMDIVKKIMVVKDSANIVIRAKTGWGTQDTTDIGWYVGYIQTPDNIYYFSNCIQSSDFNNPRFSRARMDIVYLILDELGILSIQD